ncbi:MAG TPA: TolC family protein [Gemmataceae bacterium]
MTAATLRRGAAEIALQEVEASLLQARRELARLLAVPADRADDLAVRGSLHDRAPPPPDLDELIRLALQTRPDLAAYQLSVDHARADVQLSRAERIEDVLGFYTPYQGLTFPSQGVQTATAWEVGGLTALPVFDRNQGDIARGRANVTQLQIQVQGLRDQVIYEVRRAAADYAVSRQLVATYERTLLDRARARRADKYRRFAAEQGGLDSFLAADQKYDEVVHQYLHALVQHRRSMLRLNSVVGQRILP